MSSDLEGYYEELGAWAESDAPTIRPDAQVLRGDEGRAETLAMLLAATEDDPVGRRQVRAAAGLPDEPGDGS